jgi:hypothetical protein
MKAQQTLLIAGNWRHDIDLFMEVLLYRFAPECIDAIRAEGMVVTESITRQVCTDINACYGHGICGQ